MLRIALVTTLGLAFATILLSGFKNGQRTVYNGVNDVDENAFKRKQQWKFLELGPLSAAVGVAVAAIGWGLYKGYTVLQTIEEKRIGKKPNDSAKDDLKLAERITKAEQDLANISHIISRWSETLDKQVSTPVEMLYARDNGDNSLLPNDESVSSQNKPKPEADSAPKNEDDNATAEIVGDGNEECRNPTRSAECSPPFSRPDTPFLVPALLVPALLVPALLVPGDPLSWYQETDQETSQQSTVEEPSPRSYEYEKSTEVTVSEPLCLPVGCGEVGRGQTKRIPQYQGNRRSQLRSSRGKESLFSPIRKEQPAPGETVPTRRRQRGNNHSQN